MKALISKSIYSCLVLMITLSFSTNISFAQQDGDIVALKSRHPSKNFINFQSNRVYHGDIERNVKAGLWVYEEVPVTQYFRLRKAGTDKMYLNAVQGKLVCKFVPPYSESSQWKKIKTDKYGYFRIQNRYNKTAYINSKGGTLKATNVTSDSYTSHWTMKRKDRNGNKYADLIEDKSEKPKAVPVAQPKVEPVQPATPVMPPAVLGDVVTVDGNNDRVLTNYEPKMDKNYVTFSFNVNQNITWWKGIKVYNDRGEMICLLSTQDNDKGPKYSKKFSTNNLGKVKIEYWKAKAFGVHTHVGTEYIDLATLKDYNISFKWLND